MERTILETQERKERKRKERKSIHPLNIITFTNHYNTLNECDDIRKMLKTNCIGCPKKCNGFKMSYLQKY